MVEISESLCEELGVFLEKHYTIPPISARIYATLILSASQGITFDQLVKNLQASKSTISNNLKLLQSLSMIDYKTYCGDRKKYFKINKNHMVKSLDKRINDWEEEQLMHQKILEHKEKVIGQQKPDNESRIGIKFNQLYIEYADYLKGNLEEIKQKLIKEINEE